MPLQALTTARHDRHCEMTQTLGRITTNLPSPPRIGTFEDVHSYCESSRSMKSSSGPVPANLPQYRDVRVVKHPWIGSGVCGMHGSVCTYPALGRSAAPYT
eukprot:23632-Eustigmatos_ZCMA.PRE.1